MADRFADFATYYDASHPRVLRSIALVLGDTHHAARVAHESFVRTHAAWRRAGTGDPFVYTMRCAFRLAWRVRQDDRGAIVLPVDNATAVGDAAERSAEPDLELAIAALPRAPRCVVVFSSYLGLDDRAIAHIMGLSADEVAAHRERAKGQLFALLGEDPARAL